MKNVLKKIGYSLIVVILASGYVAAHKTFAQNTLRGEGVRQIEVGGENIDSLQNSPSCTGTSGNLYGYIDTENLGRVYLNTESWNNIARTNTTVNFSVNYDRQMGTWSGRGWAAGTNVTGAIGWVDFSYDQINDDVRFVAVGTDYDNDTVDTWGNWNGIVDLSTVVYSPQNGSFQGVGIDSHTDTGGILTTIEDDYVGSGEWTFANVEFRDPACPQNVNLFLGGTSSLHRSSCDISNPVIQWTTENVTNCTATAGLWTLNTPRPDQNTGTTITGGDITDINTPVMFKLECIGIFDGQSVEGIATASCGAFDINDPNNPNNPNSPHYMIAPVLIEA